MFVTCLSLVWTSGGGEGGRVRWEGGEQLGVGNLWLCYDRSSTSADKRTLVV